MNSMRNHGRSSALGSRYQSSRHTKEQVRPSIPVTKYSLPLPPVPLLSASLGPPSFFPHTDDRQPEEDLSLISVINGFRLVSLVQDEFASLLDDMRSVDLQALDAHLKEDLNELAYLKVQMQCRVRYAIPGGYPRQTMRPESQDSFMKELADYRIPLADIVRKGVPVGPRDDAIIRQLIDYRVPYLRATWFVKVVYLNHKRNATFTSRALPPLPPYMEQRRSGPSKSTGEWTTTLCDYVQGQIRLYGRFRSIQETKEQRTERRKVLFRFAYVAGLIAWNYREGLLEQYSFFSLLLSQMKELSGAEELSLLLSLLLPYLEDLCNHRVLIETLIACCLSKSQKQAQRAGEPPESLRKFSQLVVFVLRFVLVTFPDLLAHAYSKGELDRILKQEEARQAGGAAESAEEEAMGEEARRRGCGMPLLLCGDMHQLYLHNEEVIKQRSAFMQSIVKFQADTSASKVVKLLDSFIELRNIDLHCQELLAPPQSSRHRGASVRPEPVALSQVQIYSMCSWAVVSRRAGVEGRATAVAQLLRRYIDHPQSAGLLVPPDNKPADVQLRKDVLQFIVTFRTQDPAEVTALAHLYGELIRVSVFSNSAFMRSVVSCGLLRSGSKDYFSQVLRQLPVVGERSLHNERRTLLRAWLPRNDSQIAKEATSLLLGELEKSTGLEEAEVALSPLLSSVCGREAVASPALVLRSLPPYYAAIVLEQLVAKSKEGLSAGSLAPTQLLVLVHCFLHASHARYVVDVVLHGLRHSKVAVYGFYLLCLAANHLASFKVHQQLHELVNALTLLEEQLAASGLQGLLWRLQAEISKTYNTRQRKQTVHKRPARGENLGADEDVKALAASLDGWQLLVGDRDVDAFVARCRPQLATAKQVVGAMRCLLQSLTELTDVSDDMVACVAIVLVGWQEQSECTSPHSGLFLRVLRVEFLVGQHRAVVLRLMQRLFYVGYCTLELFLERAVAPRLESVAATRKEGEAEAQAVVALAEVVVEVTGQVLVGGGAAGGDGGDGGRKVWEERMALYRAGVKASVVLRTALLVARVEAQVLARAELPTYCALVRSREAGRLVKVSAPALWERALTAVPLADRRKFLHLAFLPGVPHAALVTGSREEPREALAALWRAIEQVCVWNMEAANLYFGLLLSEWHAALGLERGAKAASEKQLADATPVQRLAEFVVYRVCTAPECTAEMSALAQAQKADVHEEILACLTRILEQPGVLLGSVALKEGVFEALEVARSVATLNEAGSDSMDVDSEEKESEAMGLAERSEADYRLHDALVSIASASLQDVSQESKIRFLTSLLKLFRRFLAKVEELCKDVASTEDVMVDVAAMQLSLLLPIRMLGILLTSLVHWSRKGPCKLYDEFSVLLLQLTGCFIVQSTEAGIDVFSFVVNMLDGLLEPQRSLLDHSPHSREKQASLKDRLREEVEKLDLRGSFRTRVRRALPELGLRDPPPNGMNPWMELEEVPALCEEQLADLFGRTIERTDLTYAPPSCRIDAL